MCNIALCKFFLLSWTRELDCAELPTRNGIVYVYVEKGITLKQNQFEELKRRGNDVSGLVERNDARGERGNNGDSEGNDKLKKSYLVVVMYL